MNQPPLAPVPSPLSLEKMAYDAIKEAILTFRFKPGESLVENDLARQLNISKTPVRESMSRLEREGFIVKIPYKGYYVTEISRQSMLDIFEIRATLEGLAARRAALNFNNQDVEKARQLIEEHRQAALTNNITLASQLNRQFHVLIIERSENERLIQILNNLEDHLRRYRTLSNFQSGRLEKSVTEHQLILEIFIQRDAQKAEALARQHILSVAEDLAQQNFEELVEKASHQT
jgi:DNA-binding GntR family transcriptional regulator